MSLTITEGGYPFSPVTGEFDAANPGVYGPQGSAFPGPRKRALRHTLAASLDRTA